jgi:NAD(P)H-quinone oxidoreductase subunit 5
MSSIAIASCLCPCAYLAVGLLSTDWVNPRARLMRRLVQAASLLVVGAAGLCLVAVATSGSAEATLFRANAGIELTFGVLVDPLSATLLVLLSGLGWVVTRFAATYLAGEPTQGRFLKWMCLTLAALLTLVLSSDVLMLAVAWGLVSLSFQRLLTHYRERPSATNAARKWILINRLGDVALVAALVLCGWTFGTLEFNSITREVATLAATPNGAFALSGIGFLFALAVVIKSAQFPLHSWLPDMIDTPTPVLALLHAGVLNAGGVLLLRLSPLMIYSVWGMDLLALTGTVTAIIGAVVMLTQTSVKKSLSYSTISQMGFLLLLCGIGAFPVALLHLVAHSCYKAHAILAGGSVLEAAAARRLHIPTFSISHACRLAISAIAALIITVAVPFLLNVALLSRPGAVVLQVVLFFAITQLIFRLGQVRNRVCPPLAIVTGLAVGLATWGLTLLADRWLGDSVNWLAREPGLHDFILIAIVSAGFAGVFGLQQMLETPGGRNRLSSLYVHAYRGFYLDLPLQRLVARVWKTQPTT